MRSFEELYAQLLPQLQEIGEWKGIPSDEAAALAHDVFVSYLTKGHIENAAAYLRGAMRKACVSYWRRERRFESGELPREPAVEPPHVAVVMAHEILRALSRREQQVLVHRYVEGCTVREVAARIGLSAHWTEKLLRRARRHAAELAGEPSDETQPRRVGRLVRRTDTYPCELKGFCRRLPWSGGLSARRGDRLRARHSRENDCRTRYHARPCTSSTRCCSTSYSFSRCRTSF